MVELVLVPSNTTNILLNHYYCGTEISWYHHSGRKPNFSSETSSALLLVSNALFPPVISAKSVLIGHNHFLSGPHYWAGRVVRCFPSWGGLQSISKHWEMFGYIGISLLVITEDSAHKNKAFPVCVTKSLVLPDKMIFSVISFPHVILICTDKPFFWWSCLSLTLAYAWTLCRVQCRHLSISRLCFPCSLIKKWDELFEVTQ